MFLKLRLGALGIHIIAIADRMADIDVLQRGKNIRMNPGIIIAGKATLHCFPSSTGMGRCSCHRSMGVDAGQVRHGLFGVYLFGILSLVWRSFTALGMRGMRSHAMRPLSDPVG